MAEAIHVSRTRIVKDKGTHRRAYIEHFADPVRYGMHGGVAKFYGVQEQEELPSTLDHIVAAVGA